MLSCTSAESESNSDTESDVELSPLSGPEMASKWDMDDVTSASIRASYKRCAHLAIPEENLTSSNPWDDNFEAAMSASSVTPPAVAAAPAESAQQSSLSAEPQLDPQCVPGSHYTHTFQCPNYHVRHVPMNILSNCVLLYKLFDTEFKLPFSSNVRTSSPYNTQAQALSRRHRILVIKPGGIPNDDGVSSDDITEDETVAEDSEPTASEHQNPFDDDMLDDETLLLNMSTDTNVATNLQKSQGRSSASASVVSAPSPIPHIRAFESAEVVNASAATVSPPSPPSDTLP